MGRCVRQVVNAQVMYMAESQEVTDLKMDFSR